MLELVTAGVAAGRPEAVGDLEQALERAAEPGDRLRAGLALTIVEALTASVRRVAELAAEGLGNRVIAQALFVTARTVEGHLTSAFRKLDLSSRSELGAALNGAPAGAAR